MASGYGRGTANRRNICRNISRRSPSTNMGNYPAVELGCKKGGGGVVKDTWILPPQVATKYPKV